MNTVSHFSLINLWDIMAGSLHQCVFNSRFTGFTTIKLNDFLTLWWLENYAFSRNSTSNLELLLFPGLAECLTTLAGSGAG